MIELHKLHPRHWDFRLIWDVLMVWIALTNLTLILFDLTYLMLRPYYLDFVPVVTRVYDPVKGIRPHPLTDELLDQTRAMGQLLALDPDSPGLQHRVDEVRRLTVRVLVEDPFDRSGQERTLEVLRVLIGQQTDQIANGLRTPEAAERAVSAFWSSDPDVLGDDLALFDARVRPLLQDNYFRELDARGRPVDHFWLIDLPFLSLFILEFGVRWTLAIRRRTYARWYFFPIFNWYDVLGCIPYTQFRLFRLLRVVSIYMRLRRSELSAVGKDFLSRGVAYVSNIIAEEVSDVVSLRILNDTQAEIRDDTHARIFDRTVARRREEIVEITVSQVREIVANEQTQQRIRTLLRLNLEQAVEDSDAWRAVPLPAVVLKPMVRGVGQLVLESTLRAVTTTLQSEEGQKAAREFTGSVLDQFLQGPMRAELDLLSKEISIDVIEHMKQAVSVRKWAQKPGAEQDALPLDDRDDSP